ncbi:MAG: CII-binding regulator of phage lambda lysogenization HflD [Saprospiraceae bacterium]|jgi:CII-binding regulator of phage lambda lysogenization HflD
MIWEEHCDLYGGELSHDQVGLIVLGRLMNRIMESNAELTERIISILDKAIEGESDILEHMLTDNHIETLDEKAAILELIKQGITE